MNKIKFEFGEPNIEKWSFEICIDRVNFKEQKIDSKLIIMDKTFCLFKLPELGVINTDPIISKDNLEAKEWLKLYANKIRNLYIDDWDQQSTELRLVYGFNYPTLQELKISK